MMSKFCNKCKTLKALSSLSIDRDKWDGLYHCCKLCDSKRHQFYQKANKAKIKIRKQGYNLNHKTEIRTHNRRYYQTNKAEMSIRNRKHYQANKNKIAIRRQRIPKIRISYVMSSNIRRSLRGNKGGQHWEGLVGYTLKDLIKRLKSTLPEGYTWGDYIGGAILHIDHIVPISVHNFKSPNDIDFKKCWALNNLQLLPAKENLSKSANIDRPFQPSLLNV